jgi:two-component system cell cycle response regulator
MSIADTTQELILRPLADDQSLREWPHLLVVQGPGIGEIHQLRRPQTIIGRDLHVDVHLPHPTVSRRHARLTTVGGQLLVEDLGSTNGTFVDLERVVNRRPIDDGDLIALGDVALLKLTFSAGVNQAFRRVTFESARRDTTTCASTLGYLLDRLRSECAYARRHKSPLVLAFIRVDDVVRFRCEGNDMTLVDAMMARVAITIHMTVRTEDAFARSAHDEFAVVVRGNLEEASTMAERIIANVAKHCSLDQTATAALVALPAAFSSPEALFTAAAQKAREAMGDAPDRVVSVPC